MISRSGYDAIRPALPGQHIARVMAMTSLGMVVVEGHPVKRVQQAVSWHKQDGYGLDAPWRELISLFSRFETVFLFNSSLFIFLVFILAPYRAIVPYNRDRDNHPFLKIRMVTINGCDTVTKKFPAQHIARVMAMASLGSVVVEGQPVRSVQHEVFSQ